ncbi:hypothetical protein P9112_005398 [Eukaryota sp. TZLM1-RC]
MTTDQIEFTDISHDSGITEVDSLCMSCQEEGVTRILLTKIPFFREIIVMSFSCPHCGFRSTDVQHGGEIAPKGSRFQLKVTDADDANRTIVKSAFASIKIPELDIEIPPTTQKGSLTTAEGIVSRILEDLKRDLPLRRSVDPDQATQIEAFLPRIENLLMNYNYTLILDDISGTSFIQWSSPNQTDERLTVNHYERTKEQTSALGLVPEELKVEETHGKAVGDYKAIIRDAHIAERFKDRIKDPKEVYVLPVSCYLCQSPGELKCCECEIPYFKTIVLMAFTCENCGYKNTEVKATGEVEDKGRRHVLRVMNEVDLKRDFLKSDYASVDIPEIDLHVTPGTLGGFFTTIEGLVIKCKEQLEASNAFYIGDSSTVEDQIKFKTFISSMENLLNLEKPFTIILDDPVGNSYIQATDDDVSKDEGLSVEEYERTASQNEELGIQK